MLSASTKLTEHKRQNLRAKNAAARGNRQRQWDPTKVNGGFLPNPTLSWGESQTECLQPRPWLSHPSEKYESQWEGLAHILWKIKNVPNHQPAYHLDMPEMVT